MISYHKQKMLPLGKLILAEYNPRQMPESEMRSLINSLVEFGFVDPVVARKEDFMVIGGHQRIAALREHLAEQGADEQTIAATDVPAILLEGVSDERAKLLNLALNRIGGEWDYNKLAEVLSSFSGMEDITKNLSGFSTKEIEDICSLMATDPITDTGEGDGMGGEDVDDALNREARKFSFEVATNDDAALVRATLQAFGMAGPRSAGDALVKALRVAAANVPAPVEE